MNRSAVAALGLALFAGSAAADFDHRLNFDEGGIWNRSNQNFVRYGSAAVVLGGALWEGSESRLGKTFWKSTEAMLAANVAAEGLKRLTRRARPDQGNDPNDWFGASTHHSFPSGEVTHMTAVVTPFLAEYGREQPAVWVLAALPVYVGVARMKSQAHWQTDVLGGAALGAAIGWYEYRREAAWSVRLLPHGIAVGLKKQF